MMKAFSIPLMASLMLLQVTTQAQDVDSPGLMYVASNESESAMIIEELDLDGIAGNGTLTARTGNILDKVEISLLCTDEPNLKYKHVKKNNGGTTNKDCGWVAMNPWKRCSLEASSNRMGETFTLLDFCPLSCGLCPTGPSLPPTNPALDRQAARRKRLNRRKKKKNKKRKPCPDEDGDGVPVADGFPTFSPTSADTPSGTPSGTPDGFPTSAPTTTFAPTSFSTSSPTTTFAPTSFSTSSPTSISTSSSTSSSTDTSTVLNANNTIVVVVDENTTFVAVVDQRESTADENNNALAIALPIVLILLLLLLLCCIRRRMQRKNNGYNKNNDNESTDGSDENSDNKYPIHKTKSIESLGSRLVDFVVSIKSTFDGRQSDVRTDVHRCSSAMCEVCERKRQAIMSIESYDLHVTSKGAEVEGRAFTSNVAEVEDHAVTSNGAEVEDRAVTSNEAEVEDAFNQC